MNNCISYSDISSTVSHLHPTKKNSTVIARFAHGPQAVSSEANCFVTLSGNSPWKQLDARAVEILRKPRSDNSSSSLSSSVGNILKETVGYAGCWFLIKEEGEDGALLWGGFGREMGGAGYA